VKLPPCLCHSAFFSGCAPPARARPTRRAAVWAQPDRVSGRATQVTLRLDYEPEGAVEKVGDKLYIVEQRAQADLMRFKQCIESRSHEAGPWQA
jgi:hypothetical protein